MLDAIPMRWQKERLDMSNEKSILDQLKDAVSARKDSLAQLRSRIATLIDPLPIGVVLADDQGELGKIERICTGASQWSNRTWDVTLRGTGLVVGIKLVADTCDRTYWDGSNMHHHSTEAFYLGRDHGGTELSWLSGRETRALAVRLPRAIERYIAECQAEKQANDSTAV
jgi:hypothetical protein